jgi:hypothetical protein
MYFPPMEAPCNWPSPAVVLVFPVFPQETITSESDITPSKFSKGLFIFVFDFMRT